MSPKYSFEYEVRMRDDVADKYAKKYPEKVQMAYEGMLEARDLSRDALEKGIDIFSDPRNNPGKVEALRRAPGLKEWFPYTKTDLALYFLYYPLESQLVPGIPLPKDLEGWQCLPIGIGLRERANMVHNVTLERSKEYHERNKEKKFVQFVVASGNGRHALCTLKEARDKEHNNHVLLLDNNPDALSHAQKYASDMELTEHCEIVEGDIFSFDGVLMKDDTTNELVKMPEDLLVPQIVDIGATGCYAYEDDWMQEGEISTFGEPQSVKRPGQITLMKQLWEHVEPGGSYLRDSANLVNPHKPEEGKSPLLEYLDWSITWNGLIPATIHGNHGVEGEFGILPMIEKANLPGLYKVVIHITPSGVFNGYELFKKA